MTCYFCLVLGVPALAAGLVLMGIFFHGFFVGIRSVWRQRRRSDG